MRELFDTDWTEVWGTTQLPASSSIYTKAEVVELILDLAGYGPGATRLSNCRLLEPACGEGAFLPAIIRRLYASELTHAAEVDWRREALNHAVLAVDIGEGVVNATRQLIGESLASLGCPPQRATELAGRWTLRTDFLLHDWKRAGFDFVVGNPPYVRLEDIPTQVLARYRTAFRTVTDRADLYVAFFECGLELLKSDGTLAFICANRFAKNQYGASLRRLIAERYHVRHYINLEHTQPFMSKVSAYPAIVVIDRQCNQPTHAVTIQDLTPATLTALRGAPRDATRQSALFREWYPDGAPWISTCTRRYGNMRDVARRFPTIEASAPGTRIGIGIATGADGVFVLPAKHSGIEGARQIPLLVTQDVAPERLTWSGHWLINPFSEEDDGSLVPLRAYPGLQAYFIQHADKLRARHCARSRPDVWYRTIDRFWPRLTHTPKLVIPDIQAGGVIGFDEGHYYPHHNVYWITSTAWDLRALQAILRSTMVTEQVRAHSVQLRGGSIRYQTQTLRQVHIPPLDMLDSDVLTELGDAATATDIQVIDELMSGICHIEHSPTTSSRRTRDRVA